MEPVRASHKMLSSRSQTQKADMKEFTKPLIT